MKQAKFAYSPLGKTLEKEKEKQVSAIESLDVSNKISDLKVHFHKNSWIIWLLIN